VIEVFHHILRLTDQLESPVFDHAEIRRWPRGTRERFSELGLLREIEPAESILCVSCGEHVITPDICEYPVVGKTVGVAKCPECGRVEIELDQLRQWAPAFDGLVRLLGAELSFHAPITPVVPGRGCLLGTMATAGGPMDVFLFRGLCWHDAQSVMESVARFNAASSPVVIVFHQVPAKPRLWGPMQSEILSLVELSTWHETEQRPDFSPLLRMLGTLRPPVKEEAWLTVTECAQLLLDVVSGLDLEKAKARVSKAASDGKFRTNGKKGTDRRVDRDSFSTWRLEQRERDLDAADAKW